VKDSIGPPEVALMAGLGPRIREVLNEMSPKGEFEPDHFVIVVDENPFFCPVLDVLRRPRAPAPATASNASELLNLLMLYASTYEPPLGVRRPSLWPHRVSAGLRGMVERLRGDDKGGKKTLQRRLEESLTFARGSRAGRKEVGGELEGLCRGNYGCRELSKGAIARTLKGLLPGLGACSPPLGELLACTASSSGEKAPPSEL
jgi:hypothetical protein